MDTRSNSEQILIVDDEPSILHAMAEAIRLLDLSVITAQSGEEAWQKFEEVRPDVVVTDVRMPDRDGLTLTTQIKASHPACPVIVVTGFGSEQAAVAALKSGASDYLVKPFKLGELGKAVERACLLVRDRWADEYVVPVLDEMTCTFVIDNFPEKLGGIVNVLLRTLTGCLSDKQLLGLRVALQEVLINAIEHGNLHISTEEKMKALMDDTYEDLLQTRRQIPEYGQRRVRVFLSHDVLRRKVEIQIVDEGDGFDWQNIVRRNAQQLPQEAGSGRGIFLTRTLVPDVQYQGKGNHVTLGITHDSVR